jgi:putative phage-type endonuclease
LKLLNLKQGTDEWHEWRRNHICASDTPIILGISPYKTSLHLFEEMIGIRKKQSVSSSMMMGHELEPMIRNEFERLTGIIVMPACIESTDFPWMGASLDGLSFDDETIVEIKLNNEDNHALAKEGKIVNHHMAQVQKQWMVGREKIRKAYYISYNIKRKGFHLVHVLPDESLWNEILRKESEFYELLKQKISPAFTDLDILFKDASVEWEELHSRNISYVA